MSEKRRFAKVAGAGIAFQAGSAAVDSATIMAVLIFQLTGSTILVGAVTAILRFGWLFPQLIVGYLAERSKSSMRYYVVGAFGRSTAIATLSLVLYLGSDWPVVVLASVIMALWVIYAFVSGIVAVPYNDIVARSVSSGARSRLLATRFFGGGVLAIGIAVIADTLLKKLTFPHSFAAIFALAAVLMYMSSLVFVSVDEPKQTTPKKPVTSFQVYFRNGISVFRQNLQFRRFVFAQWSGGVVLMAAPFYVVAAVQQGLSIDRVALLLGAQTAGALLSNLVWGWWGDFRGKHSLMRIIAYFRIVPPVAVVIILLTGGSDIPLFWFVGIFFLLGAIANGLTIAVIGLLMEISPDTDRPAYSGYFNSITAPAFLLPLLGGVMILYFGTISVFIASLLAACFQVYFVTKLSKV